MTTHMTTTPDLTLINPAYIDGIPGQHLTLDLHTLHAHAEAFRQRFPATAANCGDRLDGAIHIAHYAGIYTTGIPQLYDVQSQRNASRYYRVDTTLHTCTCPDHGRPGIICKHRLAVGLIVYGHTWIVNSQAARQADAYRALEAARQALTTASQALTIAINRLAGSEGQADLLTTYDSARDDYRAADAAYRAAYTAYTATL
jgi:hypothetical protein